MSRSALITGLKGTELTGEERAFLRETQACGIILFTRNCESHAQIRALVAAAKDAAGTGELLVLIDQEGGRVQRLRPPLGRALPPAAAYAHIYAHDPARGVTAARAVARLMAHDLKSLGINCDCAPVLDVPVAGAHDIIGNRAYGTSVASVAALGRAVAEGLMAGGVLPVIKHIPGHGRATADSHLALPVVATDLPKLSATDFATFKALADMPAAMTAHVVFSAIDARHPASTSAKVTRDIIRGAIGFDGFLMSDDLGMHALKGPMRSRAEAVIAAGSDVALHCSGDMAEMRAAAEGVPRLEAAAAKRFRRCLDILAQCEAFERAASEEALAEALAVTAVGLTFQARLHPVELHVKRIGREHRGRRSAGMRGESGDATTLSDNEPVTPGEPPNEAGDTGWDAGAPGEALHEGEALSVDVAGFEGPLDLLLALARTQKVDLARISILALVEQYLSFIAQAKSLRLEIAADYLVIAAWLAFLKSRLLLPREETPGDVASAEEIAQRLHFRLMRLDAMRNAAARLMTRKRFGLDVFGRGMPEGVRTVRDTRHTAEIYDLLKAYAEQRRRAIPVVHVVKKRRVWSIKDARKRIEALVGAEAGAAFAWTQLDLFIETFLPVGEEPRTVLASSFGATLELAREGLLELRQDGPFAPIFMRKRGEGAEWEQVG